MSTFKSESPQPPPAVPAPVPAPQPASKAQPAVPLMVRSNGDITEWAQVPKPVAVRLRQLRRAREDARVVLRSVNDEERAARDKKRDATARLGQIAPPKDAPWFVQRPHPELAPDHPE